VEEWERQRDRNRDKSAVDYIIKGRGVMLTKTKFTWVKVIFHHESANSSAFLYQSDEILYNSLDIHTPCLENTAIVLGLLLIALGWAKMCCDEKLEGTC
jgi:hypothetical protein